MFSSHKTPNLSVLTVITTRKRSLGQGNVFTPVCHSVHGEGSLMSLGSWLPGPILLLGGLCPLIPRSFRGVYLQWEVG